MLANGVFEISFKEQNPHLSSMSGFKEIYDTYSLEIADKIAWCVAFMEDPDEVDNPYARDIREDRLVRIKDERYVGFDRDDDDVELACKTYVEMLPTLDERLYAVHCRKADEFTMSLSTLNLDEDADWKKYLLTADKFKNIRGMLKAIEKDIKEQRNKKPETYGNAQLPKSEERRNKISKHINR